MRAVFSRKEPKIEAKEFCVEKVIMLPAGEYESFTNHLMHRHDFIRENVDFMYEKDGVRHCLLVTGEGMEEGVLVESEGSSYARYFAFVPSVSGILEQEQAVSHPQYRHQQCMRNQLRSVQRQNVQYPYQSLHQA